MRVEYTVYQCDYPNCDSEEEVAGTYKFLFTRSTGRVPGIVKVDMCPTHRDLMLSMAKHFRSVGTPLED